ncbi:Gfo/Idh/MocA family protein [Rugosimonospora acidiphila]|uniref:Gfo/Idh/MocA family protein n=1 Tax=Rugosimonospora acidiphila TaxID=556531 RepID=UPI0031EDD629
MGLYGHNGHQIQRLLDGHPRARLVATAGVPPRLLPGRLRDDPSVRRYGSLAELLRDPRVDLVSLCSPRRGDQAGDAVDCLRAGRAVYAEKPAALTEPDLDRILGAARESGVAFREMAGTAFDQPYLALRSLVAAGTIGTVAQIAVQKSYPYHDGRPYDDEVDGGLIGNAGIHAFRLIEHAAGQRITEVTGVCTTSGCPPGRNLTMAASLTMRCASGAVATATVNYLNPAGVDRWGNDELRVFGSAGMVEVTAGETRGRLFVGDTDRGRLDAVAPAPDYFDRFVGHLLDGAPMPLSVDDELHPTRIAIRARQQSAPAPPHREVPA